MTRREANQAPRTLNCPFLTQVNEYSPPNLCPRSILRLWQGRAVLYSE